MAVAVAAPAIPATFIYPKENNDCFWRCEAPAAVIGARCCAMSGVEVNEGLLGPNRHTPFPWYMKMRQPNGHVATITTMRGFRRYAATRPEIARGEVEAVYPLLEGAAIFPRPDMTRAILAMQMRSQGVRTIAESDDNYFADKNQNLFTRQLNHSEKVYDMNARAMASLGVNIFSTERLRDRYQLEYRTRFGDEVPLPEMHVCRNHIPDDAWPEMAEYDGPVRVGFMGSPSHVWDVHIAYAAFHAAKHAGATTTIMGYNPANPDPDIPERIEIDGKLYWTRSKKSRAVSHRWDKVIDTHIRWVAPDDYHRDALPLDIGLAPLRLSDFTLGKSDVKMIEYAISGAAGIAQDHPVYHEGGWKHEVNCLIARNQEDMGVQTLRLIRDPKLRAELVSNAQEFIRAERGSRQIREEWMAAIGG